MCRSYPIDRTTTPPELMPTRTEWDAEGPVTAAACRGTSSCMPRAAKQARTAYPSARSGPEQRHDPGSDDLIHDALVAVTGVDHDLSRTGSRT